MRIGHVSIWISAAQAAEIGATHHARLFGIVPGFIGEIDGTPLWVPRSDLLLWLEDLLGAMTRMINPDVTATVTIGREIE